MKRPVILIVGQITILSLSAQHHHDHAQDTTQREPEHAMTSAYSLSLPMTRNGSGTGWQPDASPLFAHTIMAGHTMLMFHGSIYPRFNAQNINNSNMRGNASQWDAPNWFMGMAQRPVGHNGLIVSHVMLSLDRLVMGGSGYPLLFQSGETFNNQPLIDRQHPHDFFAELSLGYSQRLSEDVDVYMYLGYPGEPALGPTAFMHRLSAMSNPDAPLAHHWQDATHVTFGVGTIGFRYRITKVEGSIFTGREPDANRFNFDQPRFDSYSYRLSVNPHETLALQFSQGFIKSPEELEPDVDVIRTTGSISHLWPLDGMPFVASSLIYGLNSSDNVNEHSVTLESNCQLHRLGFFGRYEVVQKTGEELVLPQFANEKFNIQSLTLGATVRLLMVLHTDALLGFHGRISGGGEDLRTIYGEMPVSLEVFLQARPGNHGQGETHHGH